ncbi:MAG TPA: phosphogluconate dehydratase, partial [Noviherbaspirillum sp.]|nr:phosphogluconate dehydratase [Noviherbaspirillum sp.]
EWAARDNEPADLSANQVGMGRELFAMFRKSISAAEEGAATFGLPPALHMPEEHNNPLAVPEDQSFSDEDSLIRR